MGSIGFPRMKLDEQIGIGLVACDWTLVIGSIGLLSWDDWASVMGPIGVLSWDRLDSCQWMLCAWSWDRLDSCHAIDWIPHGESGPTISHRPGRVRLDSCNEVD